MIAVSPWSNRFDRIDSYIAIEQPGSPSLVLKQANACLSELDFRSAAATMPAGLVDFFDFVCLMFRAGSGFGVAVAVPSSAVASFLLHVPAYVQARLELTTPPRLTRRKFGWKVAKSSFEARVFKGHRIVSNIV